MIRFLVELLSGYLFREFKKKYSNGIIGAKESEEKKLFEAKIIGEII